MPARVVAVAVLGGVAPAVGPDAAPGGASRLIRAFSPWIHRARQPIGGLLRGLVRLLEPYADPAVDLFARQMPPGDQRVFEDAATRLMFQEDLILGSRQHMQAICIDMVLFGRPWGFELADVVVPVNLWYGDADIIVPLHHGEHMAARMPNAKLLVRPGEGHLGGLGAAHEVFDAVFGHWPDQADRRRPRRRGEAVHAPPP